MTPDQVLKELRRELGVRQSVYPNWVAAGKLSRATADHRIEAIELIGQQLPLEQSDREQLSLFGGEP